ncbi:unnamed protein product [Bursaphelenchus xylophilus]|uniref:(pine wood nematode) hypothetical protein n=1 Tax=Bursaphelenchus xylophilus TaxID=6326 RepID=A0A1I7RVM0_BURXY|nr:unnamed protein product [Bursaphelenchus xylophilus]CAG9081873.1 unnamed protein product [Bursaphelenchus xylophilus]
MCAMKRLVGGFFVFLLVIPSFCDDNGPSKEAPLRQIKLPFALKENQLYVAIGPMFVVLAIQLGFLIFCIVAMKAQMPKIPSEKELEVLREKDHEAAKKRKPKKKETGGPPKVEFVFEDEGVLVEDVATMVPEENENVEGGADGQANQEAANPPLAGAPVAF